MGEEKVVGVGNVVVVIVVIGVIEGNGVDAEVAVGTSVALN